MKIKNQNAALPKATAQFPSNAPPIKPKITNKTHIFARVFLAIPISYLFSGRVAIQLEFSLPYIQVQKRSLTSLNSCHDSQALRSSLTLWTRYSQSRINCLYSIDCFSELFLTSLARNFAPIKPPDFIICFVLGLLIRM